MAITRPHISLPELTDGQSFSAQDLHELTLIQGQDLKGGFDWHAVQLALQYVFREASNVFVPPPSSLLGAAAPIPLLALKAKKIEWVIFSLAMIESRHQVQVSIDLRSTKNIVYICDSLDKGLTNSAEKTLHVFLGDEPFEIKNNKSPYEKQYDLWSCGVYVVAHAMHFYLQTPVQVKQSLDIHTLVKQVYLAYQLGSVAEEKNQQQILEQVKGKQVLLRALRAASLPALKSFTEFMQFELNAGSGDHEFLRTRFIFQTLEDYSKHNKTDELAKCLLRITHWTVQKDAESCESILMGILNFFQKKEDVISLREAADKYTSLTSKESLYSTIKSELSLSADAAEYWLLLLIIILLNNQASPAQILQLILDQFEDLAYCKNFIYYASNETKEMDAYHVICHLIFSAVNFLYDHEKDIENQKTRLTHDAAAREALGKLKYEARFEKLTAVLAHFSGIDSEQLKTLALNSAKAELVTTYFTNAYFEGCDQHCKDALLNKVIASDKSICALDLIVWYPGNDPQNFYQKQKEYITDHVILVSILARIESIENKKLLLQIYGDLINSQTENIDLIINMFPIADRFQFALRFINSYYNWRSMLAKIVALLLEADQLLLTNILTTQKNLSIVSLLGCLPANRQLAIFDSFFINITVDKVGYYIRELHISNRLYAAKKLKHLMDDDCAQLILRELSPEDRVDLLADEIADYQMQYPSFLRAAKLCLLIDDNDLLKFTSPALFSLLNQTDEIKFHFWHLYNQMPLENIDTLLPDATHFRHFIKYKRKIAFLMGCHSLREQDIALMETVELNSQKFKRINAIFENIDFHIISVLMYLNISFYDLVECESIHIINWLLSDYIVFLKKFLLERYSSDQCKVAVKAIFSCPQSDIVHLIKMIAYTKFSTPGQFNIYSLRAYVDGVLALSVPMKAIFIDACQAELNDIIEYSFADSDSLLEIYMGEVFGLLIKATSPEQIILVAEKHPALLNFSSCREILTLLPSNSDRERLLLFCLQQDKNSIGWVLLLIPPAERLAFILTRKHLMGCETSFTIEAVLKGLKDRERPIVIKAIYCASTGSKNIANEFILHIISNQQMIADEATFLVGFFIKDRSKFSWDRSKALMKMMDLSVTSFSLPSILSFQMHLDNRFEINQILWPILFLLDTNTISLKDLQWLGEKWYPHRLQNLKLMFAGFDSNVLYFPNLKILLNAGFALGELLDCKDGSRLFCLILHAKEIQNYLQAVALPELLPSFRRLLLTEDDIHLILDIPQGFCFDKNIPKFNFVSSMGLFAYNYHYNDIILDSKPINFNKIKTSKK